MQQVLEQEREKDGRRALKSSPWAHGPLTLRIPSRGLYYANKVSILKKTKTLLRPLVDLAIQFTTEISIGHQVLIGFNGITLI